MRIILACLLVLSLAACESRLNPMNWFGGEREQRIRIDERATAAPSRDPRPLVSEVAQLSVERTTSGAIIRATGLVPAAGYFDAELIPVTNEGGELVLEFRAAPPTQITVAGTQQIIAATSLSNGELAAVRSVTVLAAQNRRSVRR